MHNNENENEDDYREETPTTLANYADTLCLKLRQLYALHYYKIRTYEEVTWHCDSNIPDVNIDVKTDRDPPEIWISCAPGADIHTQQSLTSLIEDIANRRFRSPREQKRSGITELPRLVIPVTHEEVRNLSDFIGWIGAYNICEQLFPQSHHHPEITAPMAAAMRRYFGAFAQEQGAGTMLEAIERRNQQRDKGTQRE